MTRGPAGTALERRVILGHLPTPVVALDRLGAHLGMRAGALLAKLDDATGLAGGGNKVRKLEYLCADAIARGCDTLVTGGGSQSNHARLTAAAARRLGLDCTLILGGSRPDVPTGNVVLETLLEAQLVWVSEYGFEAIESRIAAERDALRAAGRRPYHIPIGGSIALGALGYVRCAHELRAQVPDLQVVVTASGSGGTQAGLAAGLGDHRHVLGVDVGARPDLHACVASLAFGTAALAGLPEPMHHPVVETGQVGTGYGAYTDACRDAVRLAARLEGLVLDPVYTGKALAGLIAARQRGDIAADTRVVFLHTGGLPSLFIPETARWIASK